MWPSSGDFVEPIKTSTCIGINHRGTSVSRARSGREGGPHSACEVRAHIVVESETEDGEEDDADEREDRAARG